MKRVTDDEIESLRKELCEQLGRPSVEPAAAADFATRALARIFADYQSLRRENARLRQFAETKVQQVA